MCFQMIEGCPPFSAKPENEVPKVYAAQERPPFRAPSKLYSHGLKEWVLLVSWMFMFKLSAFMDDKKHIKNTTFYFLVFGSLYLFGNTFVLFIVYPLFYFYFAKFMWFNCIFHFYLFFVVWEKCACTTNNWLFSNPIWSYLENIELSYDFLSEAHLTSLICQGKESFYLSAYRLIEECWNENPTKRPTFGQILTRLDRIYNHLGQKRRWKVTLSLSLSLYIYIYKFIYFSFSILLFWIIFFSKFSLGG